MEAAKASGAAGAPESIPDRVARRDFLGTVTKAAGALLLGDVVGAAAQTSASASPALRRTNARRENGARANEA